ncbi:CoA-binding protein [Maribellus sp. CM-23]|uniref:CoA-binding protein n=1 Tax=Maribellus sp. CM-23 TaxID=2781026 RepID=UPI001F2E38F9|nr:CoA-binding protein [Maribellus sp. CM-23]MCE4563388.1 CoA-binding protein [Maribellus sp. CM-23]
MSNSKKTLIIGASENPERYSNRAIRSLRSHNHEVLALAKREGRVEDVKIATAFPEDKVHTVSMYVGPQRQPEYYSQILEMKPQRVIFNPGTENETFSALLEENDIEAVEACTLVMLSIGNY